MLHKIIFFCISAMAIITSTTYGEDNILIVTENWPPVNYLEEEKLTRFSTEIVEKILEIIDKDYEIRLYPSMRSSHLLNNRPKTIMFSLFRTPEREPLYKWIGPLIDASIYFYKRKGDRREITSLDDIKKVDTIACRHAGLIPSLLLRKGFTNLDMTATTSLPIYRKLLIGRCDIAVSDIDLGVRYHLKSLNLKLDDVFEKLPIPIFEAGLYIACSKDISDSETEQWQLALETLKNSGIYDQILQKYY